MTLKVSMAEAAVYARLQGARRDGIASEDVRFARRTDFGPEDVSAFREMTRREGLLVIMRCPKKGAVAFQGVLPPKRWADGHTSTGELVKSGVSGIGVHPETGRMFVSDYDLMSLWRKDGTGYRKLFASALRSGAERGSWTKEAQDVVRLLNTVLQAKLQHGAQDDFTPPIGKQHPGVTAETRFAAFREGEATYLNGMAPCQAYYKKHGLYWPYDAAGVFTRAATPN
ncbi:hypothetical protein [Muricoccus radiodurans]|uniref:hypothetical protein n=1 Tax=Muricoccus radiodurans TaxID=2231721 RepID=UPI003CF0DF61